MKESIDKIILDEKSAQKPESSFRKGLTFRCLDGDNEIRVWTSSFSGMEKVYLNNKLISEARSFKLSKTQEFSDELGNNYSVEIKMESMRKPILHCIFRKNEQTLKTVIAKYVAGKNFTPTRVILLVSLIFISSLILNLAIRIYRIPESLFFSLLDYSDSNFSEQLEERRI